MSKPESRTFTVLDEYGVDADEEFPEASPVRFRIICFLLFPGLLILTGCGQPQPESPDQVSSREAAAAAYERLRADDLEGAVRLVERRVEQSPDDPALLGIRGIIAALTGRTVEARALLENAVAWGDKTVPVRFHLGELLVRSGSVADLIRGKRMLLDVVNSRDTDLVQRAGLTLLANRFIPIPGNELAALHERLAALGTFDADSPILDEAGRRAIEARLQAGGSVTEGGQTASPPVPAGTALEAEVAALGQRIEAASEAELEALVGDWRSAFASARANDRFFLMKRLGFLALPLKRPDLAHKALREAYLAGLFFRAEELELLLNLAVLDGRLLEILHITEALVRDHPDVPAYRNERAYYRFLAGEKPSETLVEIERLVEADPPVPGYRFTLALGLLKSGRPGAAMEGLGVSGINLEDAGPRERLIYAAVLAANGEAFAAEGIRRRIDPSLLIPAERELLQTP